MKPIPRRAFIKKFMTGAAGITAAGAGMRKIIASSSQTYSGGRSADRYKNIVLMVADDHGQDAGCYGNPVLQTPNLDALAEDGSRFEYPFATTASCSASRSVILTGLYNHANGQYGHTHSFHHFRTFNHIRTLPVMLGEAGYRTASIGKYHVAPEEVYQFQQFLPGSARNGVQMADNCRDFITADSSKPFFLYYCTSDPHRGGGDAEDLPYSPNRFGNSPEGRNGIDPVTYDPDDVIVPPYLPDTPTCRAELAQYYQSVTRLDQGVGRLMEILKEEGVYENTLIIYISDHGIAFPGGKTTVYEPGLKSPCIIRHPDASQRGIVNNAMINWTDITPTLLDFAGVEPPEYPDGVSPGSEEGATEGLHGRSFLSIIDQENPDGWDEINASHTFHEIQMYYPMRVVRDRQYKLIWNIAHDLPYPFASDLWAAPTWQDVYNQGMDTMYGPRTVGEYIHRPEFELYDMKNDEWESNNLAGQTQYAKVLETYKNRLKEFQLRTSDPWLMKWDYE